MMCRALVEAVILLSAVTYVSTEYLFDGIVAFSVGLNKDVHVQNGETVIFDKIFLNEGRGYDHTTGVFTTPKKGIYMFTFNFVSDDEKGALLSLYKNNDCQVDALGSNYNKGASSGGNSVLLKLEEGDKITIQAGKESWTVGSDDTVYSTFNGFYIDDWTSEFSEDMFE